MRKAQIDVTKIIKEKLYKGKKGTYLDLTFFDNKDGEDEWGNMGFVVQDLGKEARESGEKGPILGNWKEIATKKAPAASPKPTTEQDDSDDIPF